MPQTQTQPAPRADFPSWWLVVTADDMNALQLPLTLHELLGKDATATWLRNLALQLRAWAAGELPLWGMHTWSETANAWSVDQDAIPLMLVVSRIPQLCLEVEQLSTAGAGCFLLPDLPAVMARLMHLAFRMAAHASDGEVGTKLPRALDHMDALNRILTQHRMRQVDALGAPRRVQS